MPAARHVARAGTSTGPQERLDFTLDAACPATDVYDYYLQEFGSKRYAACTPQDPGWRFLEDLTLGYSYREFRAYWASREAGEFVLLTVRCVTDEVAGRGTEQRVTIGVFRDHPVDAYARFYKVQCPQPTRQKD
ncbi:MAG TPA: hypothetical protein VFO11_07030 [Candidatus Polarisedimenticolaceae bacterium]|nr:hypothetical protein [Candidatus Polarisedimenticolaceae bacterium]